MSTATAPARQPAARPPIRAVPAQATRPARAPFVVVVLVLLALGLGALLLLNTLLAQGSFTLQALDVKLAGLADREQALQQKVAEHASPQRLARAADELGMVASVNPAFLRAEDGKVLGAPVPAVGPPPVVRSVAEPASTETTQDSKPAKQDQPGGATGQNTEKNTEKNADQSEPSDNGGTDR